MAESDEHVVQQLVIQVFVDLGMTLVQRNKTFACDLEILQCLLSICTQVAY